VTRKVGIVGGGIAGLTVAERLAATIDAEAVELREGGERVGGKLRTSPFAGRGAVDDGADSFLARVPQATALARRVGLGATLTAPATADAAIWHGRLRRLPHGLLLGVPGDVVALARSRLLSIGGTLRAAVEPLLPRTTADGDSVGTLIRARFGDEVHERLVDALVGSIYAADTDRFSLAMVPQLAALADGQRSLLLAAWRARRQNADPTAPVFLTPSDGMEALATATAAAARNAGARVIESAPVSTVDRDGGRWRVDGEARDAVVLATPAATTVRLVGAAVPALAELLAAAESADVAIVTLAVPSLPAAVAGLSGYLVPKPDQRLVTAVSFGSQKWRHWGGDDEVVRVSLGRDGLPLDGLDDDALTAAAVAELSAHVGSDVVPRAVRISRWPQSFPQYRPGHRRWLGAVAAVTPPGLFLTGAAYRGIGVAACIGDAERTAADVAAYLALPRS
jgi:oxygen-dependent protoporphyrinogen oxidase